MQDDHEPTMAEFGRSLGEWVRKNKRLQPILVVSAVALILALAYQILVVQPRQRANDTLWQQKEWELRRQPVPEDDPGLAERLQAWDVINHKQRDPDYQIPADQLELIKKHWEQITSGLTADEVEGLRKTLGL